MKFNQSLILTILIQYNLNIFIDLSASESSFYNPINQILGIEKQIESLKENQSEKNITKLKKNLNHIKEKISIYENNQDLIIFNQIKKEYKETKNYLNSIKNNDQNILNNLITKINNINLNLIVPKKTIFLALINKINNIFKDIDLYIKAFMREKNLEEIKNEIESNKIEENKKAIDKNKELIDKSKELINNYLNQKEINNVFQKNVFQDSIQKINQLISESMILQEKSIKSNENNQNNDEIDKKLNRINSQIKLEIIDLQKNNDLDAEDKAHNLNNEFEETIPINTNIIKKDLESQRTEFEEKLNKRKNKNLEKNLNSNNLEDTNKNINTQEENLLESQKNKETRIKNYKKQLNKEIVYKIPDPSIIVNQNAQLTIENDNFINNETKNQESAIQNRIAEKRKNNKKIKI